MIPKSSEQLRKLRRVVKQLKQCVIPVRCSMHPEMQEAIKSHNHEVFSDIRYLRLLIYSLMLQREVYVPPTVASGEIVFSRLTNLADKYLLAEQIQAQ